MNKSRAVPAAAGPPAASGGGGPPEPGTWARTPTGEASEGRISARAHLAAAAEEFTRLVALQWELGKAEGRQIVRAVAVAAALMVAGSILAVAALVVLAAGLVAYALGVPWSHLVWTGGMALLLGLIGMGWGGYRSDGCHGPSRVVDRWRRR